jgi:hypothetical protein
MHFKLGTFLVSRQFPTSEPIHESQDHLDRMLCEDSKLCEDAIAYCGRVLETYRGFCDTIFLDICSDHEVHVVGYVLSGWRCAKSPRRVVVAII